MGEVDEILQSENRAVIWPVLVAISLFLPWVRVAGLVNLQINGIDIDVGPVILILAIAVAASWIYQDGEYRRVGWLGGGAVMGVLILISILNIQSSIRDYRAETQGNMFADSIAINLGIGVYLALIGTAAILYVGYKVHSSGGESESPTVDSPEATTAKAESDTIGNQE